MNYYFDTEFIEGKQPKKMLGIKYGETKPLVDLISIGVVCEDKREYYAVSNEFNLDHAWSDEWIKFNVLQKIWEDWIGEVSTSGEFTKGNFKRALAKFGLANKTIAAEILMFVADKNQEGYKKWLGSTNQYFKFLSSEEMNDDKPVFWAYFASTDWVAFYQLWGKMIDSPKCYPFYVMDLKNLMEFKGLTREWKQEVCPDPEGEHNALMDAKWNMKLHGIIKTTSIK